MREHREYIGTLAVLAAGSVLGLVAGGQTWGSADVPSSFTVTSVEASGADLAPLVPALSLVALAAVVLVPAVRRVGRRVVGAVLTMAGAAMTLVVVVIGADLTGRVRRWVSGTAEYAGAQIQDVSTAVVWVVVTGLGGLLVLVAGVFVALRGPRWPSMGARFERAGGAGRGRAGDGSPVRSAEGDSPSAAQAWDALDRGEDPTARNDGPTG